jgi:DNA polymerase-4
VTIETPPLSAAGSTSTVPVSMDRVILHVDMDSFFASVEVRDDPSLAGKPVIVGGSGRRGVVAACTYEARMFGVHSAMPSSVARRLCPDAVFLDGRFHRYVEESRRLHAVLESYTPLVEGISLDEAFLDVSGTVHLFGSGSTMGHAIRSRVRDDMHLECSVGVGRSKLMAKLASKAAKPRASRSGVEPGPGVVEVTADGELAFLHPMPVRALWGIGPVTEKRLLALGVTTVGELAALSPESLERYLGVAAGRHLSELSRAIDDRPVEPEQEAKSIGHEETFSTDVWEIDELQRRLQRMVDASATALRGAERSARTVTVKLRFGDFTQITRSHTLDGPVDATPAIAAVASALLDSVDLSRGVRLLGVSLTGLAAPGGGTQLRLELEPVGEGSGAGVQVGKVGTVEPNRAGGTTGDGSDGPGMVVERDPATVVQEAGRQAERLQETWGSVTDAVDAIRARYGGEAVGPASLVTPDGIRVRRRGEAQWGPSRPDRADDQETSGKPLEN